MRYVVNKRHSESSSPLIDSPSLIQIAITITVRVQIQYVIIDVIVTGLPLYEIKFDQLSLNGVINTVTIRKIYNIQLTIL